MATRTFADLSSYRRAVDESKRTSDLLNSVIGGIQQGVQLGQLPQTLQDQQLARQLSNALLQQKIVDLQNPQQALVREAQKIALKEAITDPNSGVIQTPVGLIGETIATPSAIPQTAITLDQAISGNPIMAIPTAAPGLPVVPIGTGALQTGFSIDQNVPVKSDQDKLTREISLANARRSGSSTNLKFRDIGNEIIGINPANGEISSRIAKNINEKIVSTAKGLYVYDPANPANGRIIEGTEKVAGSTDLTPAQRITAQREIRNTYDELPAKLDYFGKGQIAGSSQLKTRLDAVLKPVNNDFSKLNPQAKQTFVFALNKLRDPTSATLLAEASQIADKAGIGARFNAFIAGYKEGDPLPDQVAKDIYNVISQVESVHRENLINELVEAKKDTDELGIELTRIGVPKAIQDEVERRELNPSNTSNITSPIVNAPVVQRNRLSSNENFPSEEAARAAGFGNGDNVKVNGGTYQLSD